MSTPSRDELFEFAVVEDEQQAMVAVPRVMSVTNTQSGSWPGSMSMLLDTTTAFSVVWAAIEVHSRPVAM